MLGCDGLGWGVVLGGRGYEVYVEMSWGETGLVWWCVNMGFGVVWDCVGLDVDMGEDAVSC